MTEQACHYPGCERPADPETGGVLEVCQLHWAVMGASSEVEAWGLALNILKPWVESARAIGHDELTEVMERALAEAAHARQALMEAEATL